MKLKKALIILLVLVVGFSFISSVNAGWFDFLAPAEEETSIQEDFDLAQFEINASYENASVTMLESTPLERDFHADYEVGSVDLSEYGVDKGIVAVGQTHTTPSTCRLLVTLNLDLRNATLTVLRNNSESILGTPFEKELTGNLSTILDDAFSDEKEWDLNGLEFSYAARKENSGNTEGHSHPVPFDNVTYHDGILSYTAEFSDNSTAFDLTQMIGANSTTSFYMQSNGSDIQYLIHMPPIS